MVAGDRSKHRIVLFVNERLPESLFLGRALVECVRITPGFEVAAVVEASRERPASWRVRTLRDLGDRAVRSFFRSPRPPERLRGVWRLDAATIARRAGADLRAAPGRNLNHPDFVACLRRKYPGAVAVVLLCLQIFRRQLLESFAMAVNCHYGSLPAYRGLAATSWSIEREESRSGFTFHHMDDGIDCGAVLVEGAIPIDADATVATVSATKTRAAAAALPALLEAIARRDPGRVQEEGGAYFGRRDLERARRIEVPLTLTAAELWRRLRAFEVLDLHFGDAVLPVTALAPAQPGAKDAFETRDGVHLRAHRVLHLPPAVYRRHARWLERLRA